MIKKAAFILIIIGLILAILSDSQLEFRNKIGVWSFDGGIFLIGITLITFNWVLDKFKKEDMKFWEIISPFSFFGICVLLLIFSFKIGNTIKEDVLTYSNGEINLIVQRFETGITGNEKFRCIKYQDFLLSI